MLSGAAVLPQERTQAVARPAPPRERVAAMLRQHFRLVWRTVRRLGVPQSACDDAAQHVFIIAADRMDQIPPGKERAFLLGTACRVAANARRANARRHEVHDEALIDEQHRSSTPDPEQLLEMKQMRDLLDQLLARLSDDLRITLVLFELERLSSAEIAELLDIPVGTVASRLRRARAAFQAEVAKLRGSEQGEQP
jgi:RNA polymerase sigma-70 factor, ECF subfamily